MKMNPRCHIPLEYSQFLVALYSHFGWGCPVDENHRPFRLPYLIVSILLVFASSAARADVTGSIAGVVHDRAHAPVTGARVTVTNVQTNLSHEATSGVDRSSPFPPPPPPVSGNLNAGNNSVNGQRETANAFLVNGGDVSEGRNLGAGLVPNLDSVEEFRLITNSFDAEYGKFSGAVLNAITKSGTNAIHGDVFEFLRNDKLDAANFFTPTKSELRRNQFGYAVGGPFWRDKLFWFSDYPGTRQAQGPETGIVNVPTAAQRQGNFGPGALTGKVDGGNPGVCPACGWPEILTQRLGYTVKNGEPYWVSGCNTLVGAQAGTCVFPGGGIPQAAWSKPAIGILPYIPAPNVDPVKGTYSNNSQRSTITDNKIGERVDFNNRLTGNWSWYYHFDDSSYLNALPVGPTVAGFPSLTPTRAQEFVMSNTKTLGPTAVNEARVTFFRTAVHKDTPKGSFAKLSSLGFVTGRGTLGIITDGTPGYRSEERRVGKECRSR